jgi:hypothetical protein
MKPLRLIEPNGKQAYDKSYAKWKEALLKELE